MGTIVKVTLTLENSTIILDPNPVSIEGNADVKKGDQIVFVAGDSNYYRVIIPAPSVSNPASEYFNTNKSVLPYDVYDDNAGVTPTAKNLTTPTGGLEYTVIASTDDNAYKSDAPPRIIITPASS